ncbi:MAG: hypothetical protein AB7U38_12060, partial [Hyphomicrobiales bacterium]
PSAAAPSFPPPPPAQPPSPLSQEPAPLPWLTPEAQQQGIQPQGAPEALSPPEPVIPDAVTAPAPPARPSFRERDILRSGGD